MYYFSEIDPDYKLKGSRDPLGFQKIWSGVGHKLIKHLSTVSHDLVDFQILTYSYYWIQKKNIESEKFIHFFIKLEQAFAYARKIHLNHKSFNGTTVINKKVPDNQSAINENSPFTLSSKDKDTILTRQKTYGIYGKYIRPFKDMEINKHPEFESVIEDALDTKTNKDEINSIIDKLLLEEETTITTKELKLFSSLIENITDKEKGLFTERILQTKEKNHLQDLLYDYLLDNETNYLKEFHLYEFIKSLVNAPTLDPKVKNVLIEIENTERIISISNVAFTRILNEHLWTFKEIENDYEFWDKIIPYGDSSTYDFEIEILKSLRNSLLKKPLEKALDIIKRNDEIKKASQNSRGWTEVDGDKVKILYGYTIYNVTDKNYDNYVENHYFIDNYLGLFNQIMQKRWNIQ